MALLFLLLIAPSAIALETTSILNLNQSWAKGGRQISQYSLLLELTDELNSGSSWTGIVRGQFLGPDALEPGKPNQPVVSPLSRRWYLTDKLELELRELYLDTDFKGGHLRVGKQQIVWGQADGLKLLDVVNPQSFRQFILEDFDSSRIPLWTVNLEWYLPVGDLQFLWIPDTSMHDLPGSGATFEITAPFVSIPSGIPVVIEPVNRPDNIIIDADYGLRLSMFPNGWDVTINYLYRYDDFPVIRQRFESGTLQLSSEYERTHTVGGSASNAFGDFILRTELVFHSDKFFRAQVNSINQGVEATAEVGYVFGLDWSGLTDTFISLQIFQSFLLEKKDFVRDRRDTNTTFLVRRNFLNESLMFEFLWIYHVNDKDDLLRFKASYELTSNTRVGVYADLFDGEPDELFGQFSHLDQIGLRVTLGL